MATLLGLLSELQPTVHGSSQHCHIAPMVMDDVTNAMSSLYLIITKHGASIAEGAGGPEAVEVMESLSLLLIDVLKVAAIMLLT